MGDNRNTQTESFDDILKDIWSDIRSGGGATLLDDMMSFRAN
jgi:hypothetical protein